MRIISKYKDFYDYVQKMGQDPTLVYNRKESHMDVRGFKPAKRVDIHPCSWINKGDAKGSVYRYFIIFCNKIYPVYKTREGYFFIEQIKENYPKAYKIFKEPIDNSRSKLIIDCVPRDIPVALLTPENILYLNPKLEPFGFASIWNPERTFQEIAQFLYSRKESNAKYDGEVMSDKVSDKDLLVAKGFDKYSFRKEKKK